MCFASMFLLFPVLQGSRFLVADPFFAPPHEGSQICKGNKLSHEDVIFRLDIWIEVSFERDPFLKQDPL